MKMRKLETKSAADAATDAQPHVNYSQHRCWAPTESLRNTFGTSKVLPAKETWQVIGSYATTHGIIGNNDCDLEVAQAITLSQEK